VWKHTQVNIHCEKFPFLSQSLIFASPNKQTSSLSREQGSPGPQKTADGLGFTTSEEAQRQGLFPETFLTFLESDLMCLQSGPQNTKPSKQIPANVRTKQNKYKTCLESPSSSIPTSLPPLLLQLSRHSWVLVAHACNPSYPGTGDQEDCRSKPAEANSS
jgi:hypothetical protein